MLVPIIPMIVVYKNPSDYPDKYIARLWDLDKPTEFIAVKDTLEEIRSAIPCRFVNNGRRPNDDPVIVEVWV